MKVGKPADHGQARGEVDALGQENQTTYHLKTDDRLKPVAGNQFDVSRDVPCVLGARAAGDDSRRFRPRLFDAIYARHHRALRLD